MSKKNELQLLNIYFGLNFDRFKEKNIKKTQCIIKEYSKYKHAVKVCKDYILNMHFMPLSIN